jgi:hypothetical protein
LTFYLFAAVMISPKDMNDLRAGLVRIAGGPHWHTVDALQTAAGRAQTRQMLNYLADGPEVGVIAHQAHVDAADADAEAARRACYRMLATEVALGGVSDPAHLLVLEERSQRNFRNRDDRTHRELLAERRIPRNTRLMQTSPACERLLWLPDLVAAAYRRTITHNDLSLFDIIRDRVHIIDP